jgi:hypothetical protein
MATPVVDAETNRRLTPDALNRLTPLLNGIEADLHHDLIEADKRILALYTKTQIDAIEIERLRAVNEQLTDALKDMVWQFAYRGVKSGKENIHTGGLSALELAFDVLGWVDPLPIALADAALKEGSDGE